ncbi:lysylphosphatidylglycerol synthase transmembrane domain-containing protein [Elusimicrobiota bacterium]
MNRKSTKYYHVFIPIITIFFLYLSLRNVSIYDALKVILHIDIFYITLAGLSVVSVFLIKSLFWRMLLYSIKKNRVFNVISTYFIGQFYNEVFPLRVGEFVKVFLISKKENYSKAAVFSTIFLEKLIDGIIAFTIFISILLYIPASKKLGNHLVREFLLYILLLLLFILFINQKNIFIGLIRRFLKLNPSLGDKTSSIIDSFLAGTKIFKNRKKMLLLIAIAVFVWLIDGLFYFLIAKGINIPQIGYIESLLIVTTIAIGSVFFSTPGDIGVYEYFGMIICTSILGIPKEKAFGYIILTHLIYFIIPLTIGLGFLIKENIPISSLKKNALD